MILAEQLYGPLQMIPSRLAQHLLSEDYVPLLNWMAKRLNGELPADAQKQALKAPSPVTLQWVLKRTGKLQYEDELKQLSDWNPTKRWWSAQRK